MERSGNNFDAIRLVAALHVMFIHSLDHFGFSSAATAILPFPSVPIFFFISGYLVAASYSTSTGIRNYAEKRIARICPCLWVGTAITALSIFAFYPIGSGQLLLWAIAQMTGATFWNPDFLRGYGVGVVNGSMWALVVELALYALIPLLTMLRSRALLILGLASFACLGVMGTLPWNLAHKLLFVSPLPWAGMFIAGLLVQRHRIRTAGMAPFFVFVFVGVCALSAAYPIPGLLRFEPLAFGLVNFLLLAAAIMALAHSKVRIRLPVDLSFGLFFYHMPVVNALIEQGLSGTSGLLLAVPISITLAIASAYLVERPALRALLRRHLPAPRGQVDCAAGLILNPDLHRIGGRDVTVAEHALQVVGRGDCDVIAKDSAGYGDRRRSLAGAIGEAARVSSEGRNQGLAA